MQAVLFALGGNGALSPRYRDGVDGCMIGRSNRTDVQVSQRPPDSAEPLTQTAILHVYTPKSRVGDLLDSIVNGSRRFGEAYGEPQRSLGPFIRDVAMVAAGAP